LGPGVLFQCPFNSLDFTNQSLGAIQSKMIINRRFIIQRYNPERLHLEQVPPRSLALFVQATQKMDLADVRPQVLSHPKLRQIDI
jgi:hypothetical protein